MRRVKLVSDGTVHGTQLLNEDGRPIPGITRIEIEPIDASKNRLSQIKVTMYADFEIKGEIAEITSSHILNRKGEVVDGKKEQRYVAVFNEGQTQGGGGGGGGSHPGLSPVGAASGPDGSAGSGPASGTSG